MTEQETKDQLVDKLGSDYVKLASTMGWDIKIDFKRREPAKPDRKIDGDEFKWWLGVQDSAVVDIAGIIMSNSSGKVSDAQLQLMATAPALMRLIIDFVNHMRGYDSLTTDLMEWLEQFEKQITNAGFGCDLRDRG